MTSQKIKIILVLTTLIAASTSRTVFADSFEPSDQTPPKPGKTSPQSASGRFTMFFGPHARADQFLLDTQTGRTWQLVVDKQGRDSFQEVPVEIEGNPALAERASDDLFRKSMRQHKAWEAAEKTAYAKRRKAEADKLLQAYGYAFKDDTGDSLYRGAVKVKELDKDTNTKFRKLIDDDLPRDYPEEYAEYLKVRESWREP